SCSFAAVILAASLRLFLQLRCGYSCIFAAVIFCIFAAVIFCSCAAVNFCNFVAVSFAASLRLVWQLRCGYFWQLRCGYSAGALRYSVKCKKRGWINFDASSFWLFDCCGVSLL
ncbi:MAG: hypothetical protein ACI4UL_05530, partial [Muribaculaceae bacterium]